MFKLLSAAIASGFAFGLSAAIAQTVEPAAQKPAADYKVMKDNCSSMGEAARQQCLKDSKPARADAGCEKLTDRDKRECMLDAFIKRHDRVTGAAEVRKSNIELLRSGRATSRSQAGHRRDERPLPLVNRSRHDAKTCWRCTGEARLAL